MEANDQNAAWRSLWGDVLKGALVANLAITLGTVGLQAAVLKFFNLDDLVSFFHIFCSTAPLAAAVAITLYAAVRTDDDSYVIRLLLVSAASFWAATWLGHRLGAIDFHTEANVFSYYDSLSIGNAGVYIVNMLIRYYEAYGVSRFVSSLAVGSFLAWTWLRVEYHFYERSLAAASPATSADSATATDTAAVATLPAKKPTRRRTTRKTNAKSQPAAKPQDDASAPDERAA